MPWHAITCHLIAIWQAALHRVDLHRSSFTYSLRSDVVWHVTFWIHIFEHDLLEVCFDISVPKCCRIFSNFWLSPLLYILKFIWVRSLFGFYKNIACFALKKIHVNNPSHDFRQRASHHNLRQYHPVCLHNILPGILKVWDLDPITRNVNWEEFFLKTFKAKYRSLVIPFEMTVTLWCV